MKLSVIFIPDEGYTRFLSPHSSSLSSIYFSLPSGPVTNTRIRIGEGFGSAAEAQDLCPALSSLRAIDKYILRFLERCIRTYINECFNGNLLDLTDTQKILALQLHIDNTRLGLQPFTTLTSCTKRCKPCKICSQIFSQASWKKEITFKSYRVFQ